MEPGMADKPYDVVIVGGGPAGLTCALFLARARRKVIVVDAGVPRNRAARAIYGLIGQHGIAPAELLAKARREVLKAGVELFEATVERARQEGDLFAVDAGGRTVRGRRIVLAYGLRDLMPDLENLGDFYGHSVFHCVDCDGFEVCDRRVGVIGWTRKAIGLALELRHWSPHITVLAHGHEPEWSRDEFERLGRIDIPVRGECITKIAGQDGQIDHLEFAGGDPLQLDAMFFTLGLEQTCRLAGDLGCACAEIAPFVSVSSQRETSIPGAYAIGDIVAGSQLVVTAAADGAIAAIAINKSLMEPECRL
jgi:thioredoxin reductase